jgi:hypothetical protein
MEQFTKKKSKESKFSIDNDASFYTSRGMGEIPAEEYRCEVPAKILGTAYTFLQSCIVACQSNNSPTYLCCSSKFVTPFISNIFDKFMHSKKKSKMFVFHIQTFGNGVLMTERRTKYVHLFCLAQLWRKFMNIFFICEVS